MDKYFDHELAGCAPLPLAAYLKALGVLRVLGGQADPGARGSWRGDAFVLTTRLDRDALLEFFTWEYRPTPLVAPWNGGSGFYPRDSKIGIEAIADSTAPRFAAYREAIAIGRELIGDQDEAPTDEAKIEFIRACRVRLYELCAEWLDTALVLTIAGRVLYPALLGTGGNDGRLDFSNNQMQRLTELLSTTADEPRGDSEALLESALFGAPVAGLFPGKAIGQFHPGATGGPSSTSSGIGRSLLNPWEYVLMLEGALLLRVTPARRVDAHTLPQAAAPFAVRAQAAGYASASPADESPRGELWLPLWSTSATLAELRALLDDARLQTGPGRARRARGALDAAMAAARQGTARPVRELVRYGFVQRNGQAHLAVPLSRWRVASRPWNHLLDDIALWVDRNRQRSTSAPAALGQHVRAIERIMFALCRENHQPERWGALLCALGRFEDRMVARPSLVEAPIAAVPALSPGWALAADDGSAEYRLAVALASQYSRDRDAIRYHCAARSPRHTVRYGGRFHISARGTFGGRDLVWTGRDLIADLCALAWRRLVCSRAGSLGGFELRGRVWARLDDVHAFLTGSLDDARLAALARGLMAIRWQDARAHRIKAHGIEAHGMPWPVYALFRWLYRPDRPGAVDPEPLRLLVGDHLGEAVRLALRRLGHRDRAHAVATTPGLARRLAASLCFPIDSSRAWSIENTWSLASSSKPRPDC
jgi:CRISPR-associated protein Csx17